MDKLLTHLRSLDSDHRYFSVSSLSYSMDLVFIEALQCDVFSPFNGIKIIFIFFKTIGFFMYCKAMHSV